MSRALDKDTLQALSCNDPKAAYKAISQAITQYQPTNEADELLEIEILPKSHVLDPGTFLLQDGNALGISKLGLVQAFFWARKLFQGHQGSAVLPDELLAITSVMLLMDPEHLTAANARKRVIQEQEQAKGRASSTSTAPSTSQQLGAALIRKDQFFVDSLLTSRLHRHTKSPTLWSHRRWLIQETVRSCGALPDVTRDVRRVVMVAGERHPRNYYAWCHARWLLDLVLLSQQDHQQPPQGKQEKLAVNVSSLLPNMTAATKAWCLRNHSDISGWSFLATLLPRLDAAERHSVFTEVVTLCGSLRWANESAWVFLRTLVAASGVLGDEDVAFFHNTLASLLRDCQEGEGSANGASKRILQQAQVWFEAYQERRPAAVVS